MKPILQVCTVWLVASTGVYSASVPEVATCAVSAYECSSGYTLSIEKECCLKPEMCGDLPACKRSHCCVRDIESYEDGTDTNAISNDEGEEDENDYDTTYTCGNKYKECKAGYELDVEMGCGEDCDLDACCIYIVPEDSVDNEEDTNENGEEGEMEEQEDAYEAEVEGKMEEPEDAYEVEVKGKMEKLEDAYEVEVEGKMEELEDAYEVEEEGEMEETEGAYEVEEEGEMEEPEYAYEMEEPEAPYEMEEEGELEQQEDAYEEEMEGDDEVETCGDKYSVCEVGFVLDAQKICGEDCHRNSCCDPVDTEERKYEDPEYEADEYDDEDILSCGEKYNQCKEGYDLQTDKVCGADCPLDVCCIFKTTEIY